MDTNIFMYDINKNKFYNKHFIFDDGASERSNKNSDFDNCYLDTSENTYSPENYKNYKKIDNFENNIYNPKTEYFSDIKFGEINVKLNKNLKIKSFH